MRGEALDIIQTQRVENNATQKRKLHKKRKKNVIIAAAANDVLLNITYYIPMYYYDSVECIQVCAMKHISILVLRCVSLSPSLSQIL